MICIDIYRFLSTSTCQGNGHGRAKTILARSTYIVSVKSCTALIMAINLNKVAFKPAKSRCYFVQSATERLPQEISSNAPWFAPLAFNIGSVALNFFRSRAAIVLVSNGAHLTYICLKGQHSLTSVERPSYLRSDFVNV